MERRTTLKLVAGAAAALVVAGGGGAIAANGLGSPKEESQAVLDDAAKQLGVAPAALDDALRKALANRVDAAVAAGELTKEQGDALKARIAADDFPLFAGPRGGFGHHRGHGGFGHFGHGLKLEAAATYLGLTEAELRTALAGGKTLAEVAKDEGKTVEGLVGALVDAKTKKLDAAVAAGRLTAEQRTKILEGLEARITAFVNGEFPRGPGPEFRRHGFGHGGSFRGERPSRLPAVA